jgi:hypothetical protein
MQDFPDVFAFPRLVTTREPREARRYRADLPDLLEGQGGAEAGEGGQGQRPGGAAAAGQPSSVSSSGGGGQQQGPGSAAAAGAAPSAGGPSLWPEPEYMPAAEFQAATAAGAFAQHGAELFRHELVAAQWGVTPAALQEVVGSGRLPLLEMEVEGVELLRAAKVG